MEPRDLGGAGGKAEERGARAVLVTAWAALTVLSPQQRGLRAHRLIHESLTICFPGWDGGHWALRVRAVWPAARLGPPPLAEPAVSVFLVTDEPGEAGGCEGSHVPEWGPPGGRARQGTKKGQGNKMRRA